MLRTPLPQIPPNWIELIPAGADIVGQDGRRWRNSAPAGIVTAFQRRHHQTPMVIDYEHASEHRAPQGLDAPAAGWIDRLEVRQGGSIWGHVQHWTEKAAQRIRAREYRFLSPVFLFDKATSSIREIISAALTNQPNLPLTALNTSAQGNLALDNVELHALAKNAARCWDQGHLKRTYGIRENFINFCLARAAEHENRLLNRNRS